jgi:hypothetical protein
MSAVKRKVVVDCNSIIFVINIDFETSESASLTQIG